MKTVLATNSVPGMIARHRGSQAWVVCAGENCSRCSRVSTMESTDARERDNLPDRGRLDRSPERSPASDMCGRSAL